MNDLSDRHLVKRKDLIFRSRGQTTTAAIIDTEIGPAIVAAPLLRIRVTSKHVLPEYLYWFVNQPISAGVFAQQGYWDGYDDNRQIRSRRFGSAPARS